MLRGYTITYLATCTSLQGRSYARKYTQFFHLSGKYSWFQHQIGQQRVGNLVIPIWVKRTCLYDIRDFIGPVKGKASHD